MTERLSATERLGEIIYPIAQQFETQPEYWIHGSDEGPSFCYDCAQQKIGELLKENPDDDICLGGGFINESDSSAFCDTCNAPLENSLTDYGVDCELGHFEETPLDLTSPSDCYYFYEMIIQNGGRSHDRLEDLCEKILERIEAKK